MFTTNIAVLLIPFLGVGFSIPTRNREVETIISYAQSSAEQEAWPAMDISWIANGAIDDPYTIDDSFPNDINNVLDRDNEVYDVIRSEHGSHHHDDTARKLLYYFLSKMTP